MGEEFLAVGRLVGKNKNEDGPGTKEDIKAQAKVAIMTTMAKAQGQEVNDDDMEQLIKRQKEMAAEQVAMANNSEETK